MLNNHFKILETYYKIFIFCFIVIFFFFAPIEELYALNHNWIKVPESKYGKQLWDKKSISDNNDGSLRVLSKYIPKIQNENIEEIVYIMDIDCKNNTYRDIAVGLNEIVEPYIEKKEWRDPNGDNLILGVINDVCFYKKS